MKRLKKINLILIIMICTLFFECKNDNISTGISEIDNFNKFKNKQEFNFNKDSAYTKAAIFYNQTLKDSFYTVALTQKNGYQVRARGWGFDDNRIGDWYYEKVYEDHKVIIDSIVNYIKYCEKNPRNTVKKYKNNKLNRSKGYFYEIDMKKDIHVGDTLLIKLNFLYDTLTYRKVGKELYFFKPPNFYDHCNPSQYVLDSFPIVKNTAKMQLLMSEKGKNRFLGYYYLVPKKQNSERTEVMQVFTEINFEVK